MGMAGHLMILREDTRVFAHIHPMGTLSGRMAMMMVPGIDHAAMGHAGMSMGGASLPPRVKFPFAFPENGRYRMFVQVKFGGKVHTGVFDVSVE